MTVGDWLELYVCLILTAEFIYDYLYNSREARKKRREKKVIHEIVYEKDMD